MCKSSPNPSHNHAHLCTHEHTCMTAYMHTHVHKCKQGMCTHAQTYTHSHTHTHIHTCTHTCLQMQAHLGTPVWCMCRAFMRGVLCAAHVGRRWAPCSWGSRSLMWMGARWTSATPRLRHCSRCLRCARCWALTRWRSCCLWRRCRRPLRISCRAAVRSCGFGLGVLKHGVLRGAALHVAAAPCP